MDRYTYDLLGDKTGIERHGASVLASDGTVYFHEKGEEIFVQLFKDAGSAERKNEGWFVYT